MSKLLHNLSPNSLILKKFEIYELFGTFNYDNIELSNDEGLIILYGPNGTGKTTILTLISLFKEGKFVQMAKTYFKTMRFYFEHIKSSKIYKKRESNNIKVDFPTIIEIERHSPKLIEFKFFKKEAQNPYYTYKSTPHKDIEEIYKSKGFYKYDPVLFREYRNIFAHRPDYDYLEKEELKSLLFTKIIKNIKEDVKSKEAKFIKEFETFNKKITEIRNAFRYQLIPAQRLDIRTIHKKKPKVRSVVEHKSNLLVSKIKEKLSEYTVISQTQDKDLIKRIIKSIETPRNYTYEQIYEELDRLEKVQEDYRNAGLDTSEVSSRINLMSSLEGSLEWKDRSQIQTLYGVLEDVILSDSWKKIKVFTNLYKKINLFQSIINKHLKNKILEIHHNEGIVIKNSNTKEVIHLDLLSSGEMNIIILFFELIFDTEPYTLIMIDEPEISLHVEWQIEFVNNLLKIKDSEVSELTNTRFILATHSPQIIHDHRKLAIELEMEE